MEDTTGQRSDIQYVLVPICTSRPRERERRDEAEEEEQERWQCGGGGGKDEEDLDEKTNNSTRSSDDGTCRIWDARQSLAKPRIYIPKPPDSLTDLKLQLMKQMPGKGTDPPSAGQQTRQILCCAFNANGTVFVTGSSDTYARVWNACKSNTDDSEQPNHEMDLLSGHENDVNYVQFRLLTVGQSVKGERHHMHSGRTENKTPDFS
ncbi:WD domain, G-beta repeat [Musa troglodytarum]|uniref:WD domain, G-beta repeat n=1 Tax=Musa troglodytarum TaxID=320322 RepID=A0A9E7ERB9_9LILI|nr:WD domain, G-beta repeat [Musa troglodytarum]